MSEFPHRPEGKMMSREDAEKVMRDARLARQQAATRAPRRRPVAPQAQPQRREPVRPVAYQPQGTPRPSSPVSKNMPEDAGIERSHAPRTYRAGSSTPQSSRPSVSERGDGNERVRRIKYPRTLALGGVAVAVVAAASFKMGVFDDIPVVGESVEQAFAGSNVTSEVAEEVAIEMVGPEGFTLENCQEEGAAVTTLTVSGRYPLRYMLKNPEGKDVLSEPYLVAPEEVITESGYPELMLNDMVIKLYACQSGSFEGRAIEQMGSDYVMDLNGIDIKAAIQTNDNGEIPKGTLAWPSSSFISPNPENYTDESVAAVEAAHTAQTEDGKYTQLEAALYSSIDTVLSGAGQASAESVMNQVCEFSGDSSTTAQVIREGMSYRLAGDSDKVSFANAVGNIGGTTFKKDMPALVFTPPELPERFIIDSCAVTVGDSGGKTIETTEIIQAEES